MESINFNIMLPLEAFGAASNLSTLVYILRNFDIKVHVYTLIFIDALFCSASALASFLLDVMMVTELIAVDRAFCTISLLSLLLPVLYGSILTFMVALVRYVLSVKAAKNSQVGQGLMAQVVEHEAKAPKVSTLNPAGN